MIVKKNPRRSCDGTENARPIVDYPVIEDTGLIDRTAGTVAA